MFRPPKDLARTAGKNQGFGGYMCVGPPLQLRADRPGRPAEAAAQPPSEGKGGLKMMLL